MTRNIHKILLVALLLFPVSLFCSGPELPAELKAKNTEITQLFFDNDPSFSKLRDPKKLMIPKDQSVWFSFSLQNRSAVEIKKTLLLGYSLFNAVELYAVNDQTGQVTLTKSGPAFGRQNVFYKVPAHPLFLKAGESKTVYIKITNSLRDLPEKFYLLSGETFDSYKTQTFLLIGVLFGALFLMILYNGVIAFYSRQPFYYYYLFYLVCSAFALMTFFNIGTMHIWGSWSRFNEYDLYIGLHIYSLSAILFSRKFLNLRHYFPKIDTLLLMIFGGGVISLVLLPFFLGTIQQLLVITGSGLVIGLYGIGFLVLRKGYRLARPYLISWTFLVLGIEALFLSMLDVVSLMGATLFYSLCVFLELFLFSLVFAELLLGWKKEKETAALKLSEERKNREAMLEKEITNKTTSLRQALKERDTLLSEVHHRVKNNMQIIMSLIRLQSDQIGKTDKAFEELEERIRAMAVVHEMLYQNGIFDTIDLNIYIDELVEQIAGSMGRPLVFTNKVLSVSFTPDRIIPLGLIIAETLINTFKHARVEGTLRFEASLEKEGETYTLTLKDNGEQPPENYRRSGSLGTELIHAMAKGKLGGSAEIFYDGGTVVKVRFHA